jgi:hypothetical protein
MEKLNAVVILQYSEEAALDTLKAHSSNPAALSEVLGAVFRMGAYTERHAEHHGYKLDFKRDDAEEEILRTSSAAQVHAAIATQTSESEVG